MIRRTQHGLAKSLSVTLLFGMAVPCSAAPWMWLDPGAAPSDLIDLGRVTRAAFLKDTLGRDYVELNLLGSPSRLTSDKAAVIATAKTYVDGSPSHWVKLEGSGTSLMKKASLISVRFECASPTNCYANIESAHNGAAGGVDDAAALAALRQLVSSTDWVLAQQAPVPDRMQLYINVAFVRRAIISCSAGACSADVEMDGPRQTVTTRDGIDRLRQLPP